ncbi:hypothetical protein CP960_03100 [Malaciobacter halophilus]|uniref:Uncharacterized protein n=1 Tax=Malaciobacter halophilus TaxID=197482 RepID=A0A2N1J587_9BACT|nr:hypothetical protein CP960_03100 [Malaciobacter halophilus]
MPLRPEIKPIFIFSLLLLLLKKSIVKITATQISKKVLFFSFCSLNALLNYNIIHELLLKDKYALWN